MTDIAALEKGTELFPYSRWNQRLPLLADQYRRNSPIPHVFLREFLEPEIALVTAGVETDVLGFCRDDLSAEAIQAVTAAHPRPDFKNRILRAFTDGMKHRPHSTFGTMNADVLERFDDSFVRDDFVEIIRNNSWPE